MRSEKAAIHLPQSYVRQPGTLSFERQQLFDPGMPAPEMDQQLTGGEAMSINPLNTESSSMRPQPPQQRYDYSLSGADHSIYSVIRNTPFPSWPGPSTENEPPQQSGHTRGHAHSPAPAADNYERERQGQSWTPPPLDSSLSAPSCNMSPPSSQPQPLWEGKEEAEARREVNEERESDKEVNEKGEWEMNWNEDCDRRVDGDGEVYGRGSRDVTGGGKRKGDSYHNREKGEVVKNGMEEGEGDDVWTYCIILTSIVALQLVVEVFMAAVVVVLN